jgi:hypothetical protein
VITGNGYGVEYFHGSGLLCNAVDGAGEGNRTLVCSLGIILRLNNIKYLRVFGSFLAPLFAVSVGCYNAPHTC